jgi:hypothetical protein
VTAERKRLVEDKEKKRLWRKFGPYLADRQWGTVREDYSPTGDAWNFVTHDMARSKAYRWGEEGIGGICDDQQLLCFAPTFWNKKDPIIKERLFGLSNPEGNHGEDCKELYYYLDSTPTHSYMKMLYKYPVEAYPYRQLVNKNHNIGKNDREFEILDTGVFNDSNYFDIFVEYAKADADDILIRITTYNRSKQRAPLYVMPTIWFRNIWEWNDHNERPSLSQDENTNFISVAHHKLKSMFLYFNEGASEVIFCENETNTTRLYNYHKPGTFKDGVNDYIIDNKLAAVNVEAFGTKAAVNYKLNIEAGDSATVQLRLSATQLEDAFSNFDEIFNKRISEADEFYVDLQQRIRENDLKLIQRQAFAGLLWSKQFYNLDVSKWLNGDPHLPTPPESRKGIRNFDWMHLHNADVISMPDKWEYPWYAAWDLAFHCIPFSLIDPEFAKQQLLLLTKEWYMHPNGQLPAYEWSFSDVNPPVHGWAAWRVYKIDEKIQGKADRKFLEEIFHKLLLNFTWWVNKKDTNGNNIFQGGFLGMDNIGVFDRSASLPEGGFIEQSDGTSWMAMFTLNMLRMSLELSKENPTYQSLSTKFFEHFLYIAGAMANVGNTGIDLWDDEDQFFYDVLHTSKDERIKMKVRSMVGLIPLFAVEVLDQKVFDSLPEFTARLQWFLQNRPDLANLISRWTEKGSGERHLLSLLRGHRMKCLLKRMLDENEFLSPYGIRALSRYHLDHPYKLAVNGTDFTVQYNPGESDSYLFGGNSNWRGPIWFPVNYLIIESLQRFHHYYGDDFLLEHPTGSGQMKNLNQIAEDLSARLVNIFKKQQDGTRAVFAGNEILFKDKHFQNHLLFYEYFHGDTGEGLGASHQTGWTALVAKLIQPRK